MKKLLCNLALLTVPALLAAQDRAAVSEAVNSITVSDVRERIGILAHDSMMGRDTPSPELEQTANYIAGQFYSFGLKPAGDAGSYLQRYPLLESGFDLTAAGVYAGGERIAALGEDAQFIFQRTPPETADGEVVVLHGATFDPDRISRLNLAGKIVAVVTAAGDNGNFTPGLGTIFRPLLRQRPASVLVIIDRADSLFQRAGRALESTSLLKGWDAQSGRGFAFLEVRPAAVADALARAGFNVRDALASPATEMQVVELAETGIEVRLPQRIVRRTSAPNVVGLLEGSDPRLRDEYIVFSAHMDHVGVGTPDANGDSIFNGADDDASGTVAVVELAEAFAMLDPAPRRSMIFLTVSGEEKGLWGSEYFSLNMPVPTEQVVANLNIDMIGRNWSDTIVVIGKEHSDLGATLNEVGTRHPELNMAPIDDLWPEESFYTRSDHFNFANKGVPILFFFNGTHPDYHGRDDEPDKIGYDKHTRITKLVFYLGHEIAQRDARPAWEPDSYEQIVGSTR